MESRIPYTLVHKQARFRAVNLIQSIQPSQRERLSTIKFPYFSQSEIHL
jgi:hypothetical protein